MVCNIYKHSHLLIGTDLTFVLLTTPIRVKVERRQPAVN